MKHLLLPAAAAADAWILPLQFPPPGGVLRLKDPDKRQFVCVCVCAKVSVYASMPACIHKVQSPTPLLAGSGETDAKVNNAIGAPLISSSRARFNFKALICEIMAADCNIVISRRIK